MNSLQIWVAILNLWIAVFLFVFQPWHPSYWAHLNSGDFRAFLGVVGVLVLDWFVLVRPKRRPSVVAVTPK